MPERPAAAEPERAAPVPVPPQRSAPTDETVRKKARGTLEEYNSVQDLNEVLTCLKVRIPFRVSEL